MWPRTQDHCFRHRAPRDVRRTTEGQALREALHFRPHRGQGRLKLNASLRHDETSLCSYPLWCPEHQDLSFVYSGSVDRFRFAQAWEASHRRGKCQLCARSKRRSGSPSALGVGRNPSRCETDQVGRRSYLVTGAAVLRRPLHAQKLRDEGVRGSYERWHLSAVRC